MPIFCLLYSFGFCCYQVNGFGSHADLQPFGVLFKEARLGAVALDAGSFWFRGGGDSILLTEGRAGFCGGVVRVYALHMNLASLDAGFTVLLDGLEAGALLGLFPDVRGTATGQLYGKLPLAIRKGSAVRLRDAYLFSPPGQVGRIELEDPAVVVDKLSASGVPEEACASLEQALRNLDYDVLRRWQYLASFLNGFYFESRQPGYHEHTEVRNLHLL